MLAAVAEKNQLIMVHKSLGAQSAILANELSVTVFSLRGPSLAHLPARPWLKSRENRHEKLYLPDLAGAAGAQYSHLT